MGLLPCKPSCSSPPNPVQLPPWSKKNNPYLSAGKLLNPQSRNSPKNSGSSILFLYLEPVVAIVGAVILLKETLNNYQLFGAIVVLASLALATYLTKKSKNDIT